MTIPELEFCLCASVMDEPTAKLGPNICTALRYSDMWESPEAAKVAEGIKRCIEVNKPTHRTLVLLLMDEEYVAWPNHPSFTQGLPLSSMEPEALTLVKHYRNKQLVALISNAHLEASGDNSKAVGVATVLWEDLGNLLCKWPNTTSELFLSNQQVDVKRTLLI